MPLPTEGKQAGTLPKPNPHPDRRPKPGQGYSDGGHTSPVHLPGRDTARRRGKRWATSHACATSTTTRRLGPGLGLGLGAGLGLGLELGSDFYDKTQAIEHYHEHVSPHLPISPHLSPHISPYLPTSPHISQAIEQYHDHIKFLLRRTNSISGRAYRHDPTILAWQVAPPTPTP